LCPEESLRKLEKQELFLADFIAAREKYGLEGRRQAIAKVERRADMYLSTLRSVIEAMGVELDVRAVFPDGSVRIKKLRKRKKRA
jgi:hypothetical protein